MPQVYDVLHRLAAAHLRDERPGHTLRATDLVNEAYLRLGGAVDGPEWNDRAHFFAITARSMRQVLIDHARKRGAARRGGAGRAVTLDEDIVAADRSDELLALDEALEALAKEDERKARVVELHYFGGLTQGEIAEALSIHVNTVARDLRYAQAWLQRHLLAPADP